MLNLVKRGVMEYMDEWMGLSHIVYHNRDTEYMYLTARKPSGDKVHVRVTLTVDEENQHDFYFFSDNGNWEWEDAMTVK